MTRILHADDRMGAAAHAAAMFAAGFDMDLLTACGAAPDLTRDQRVEALERAFRKWRGLERAMAELIQSAPNVARSTLGPQPERESSREEHNP